MLEGMNGGQNSYVSPPNNDLILALENPMGLPSSPELGMESATNSGVHSAKLETVPLLLAIPLC